MENFSVRFETFLDILINDGGYKDVIEGLKNTMTIAVVGLVIGIVIGTLIATIRVLPKYKIIVRLLDKFCGFYVSVFRGTPMVVQLLVFYYVLVPLVTALLETIYCDTIVPLIAPSIETIYTSLITFLTPYMENSFVFGIIVPAINSFKDSLLITSIRIPSVSVAIIVFGLNSGAYISEIMRAGILSVDPGQLLRRSKIFCPPSVMNLSPLLKKPRLFHS